MKRIIAFLLTLMMMLPLCSCGFLLEMSTVAKAAEPMSLTNNYNQYITDEGFIDFKKKVELFSSELTEKVLHEQEITKNAVISPLSIYMALALACECAVGETRQEILDAVGVTYEQVEKYTSWLYSFANREYTQTNAAGIKEAVARQELNNSIWLDDSVSFKRDGVDKLARDFNCDVFQASVASGEAQRLINLYIEEKSRGLLDGDVNLPPETYFVLMNNYYLKDIWNATGRHLNLTSEKIYFTNADGSTTHTSLLEGYYNDGKAYDGDRFSVFFTSTDHNFKIYFFVPDEEWSVKQVFTSENISAVLNIEDWGAMDDENMQHHLTRVLFPEFEADFSDDISDILTEDFGVETLFDPFACDMSNVTDEPVYCDGVIHKAALKVDRTGIEGAAATVMPVCGNAGPIYEMVYHDFTVTRDFGFIVTDPNGTIVFSGVINTIQ